MRYAIGIEYDGAGFLGWQAQRQEPTVQAVLERAIASVADHELRITCAGRTDTGVHGLCQVAHFDSEADRSTRSWILGINSNLPSTVRVLWLQPVRAEFHARFSALARHYRYRILNRWIAPAIGYGQLSWQRRPLDAEAMHRASKCLLGEHDFSAFRSAGCRANHPVREIQNISVKRKDDEVILDVSANGFLYHMVRNVAGTLMAVGTGDHPEGWVEEVLESRDRTQAGVTAAPDGLYFAGVRYPDDFGLPASPPVFPEGSGKCD